MEIQTGNIIEVLKKSYLVVDTKKEKNVDKSKGKSFEIYQFTTISKEDFDAVKENPKEKIWTIKDMSSIHGKNEIRLTNILVKEKINLQKSVKTMYYKK